MPQPGVPPKPDPLPLFMIIGGVAERRGLLKLEKTGPPNEPPDEREAEDWEEPKELPERDEPAREPEPNEAR